MIARIKAWLQAKGFDERSSALVMLQAVLVLIIALAIAIKVAVIRWMK